MTLDITAAVSRVICPGYLRISSGPCPGYKLEADFRYTNLFLASDPCSFKDSSCRQQGPAGSTIIGSTPLPNNAAHGCSVMHFFQGLKEAIT